MRRPMAIWKQAAIAVAIVGAAAFGWTERETVSAYLSGDDGAGASLAATSAAPEERGRGRRGGGGRRGGRDGRPAPVIVAEAELRADDLALEIVGTARAQRSVDLRVQGSGEVLTSTLEAGRAVEEGEVLVELDDEAAALAVDLARARRDAAERALARQRELERSGATSETALDTAATDAAYARIELARATRAREDLTLTAPFAGVLGLPRIEGGDWVDQGDVAATLDDRSALLIEAMAPETLVARTSVGAEVGLRTASAPGARLVGEIVAIDSRIDPQTRSARLRVAVPNPDDALLPGASFVLELTFPGPDYPAAPELALQYGRDGLYVWRVRDAVAERAPVRLVRRQAGVVLLESLDGEDPLEAGDLIVVEGVQRVRDGGRVRMVGAPVELDATR